MKCTLAATSLALFLADAFGVAAALSPDQIFDRVAPSVWSVHAVGADGKPLASANGLSVAPGRVVTSCRTLARARRVELRQGSKVYDAKLEFPDVERDLCQLHVPELNTPVLAQGSARTLRPGQRVYVIGFSLGDQASIADGLVSAVRDAGGKDERIQTTVPAAAGLLGAGVFDEEGRLVALVTSSPKEAAATAFALPADWLADLAVRGQAALAGRAKAATKTYTPRAGIPAAGSQWAYRFFDRQFGRRPIDMTVVVTRADGSSIEESLTSSGSSKGETQRTVSADESRFLSHDLAGGAELTEFAPYFLAANGEKASSVSITAAGYPVGAGFPEWVARTKPQIWEQVTVPAGTFKALRLEISGQRVRAPSDPNATREFLIRVWYAPEVQRYVRLEHKEWMHSSRQISHVVVELTKFSPPS